MSEERDRKTLPETEDVPWERESESETEGRKPEGWKGSSLELDGEAPEPPVDEDGTADRKPKASRRRVPKEEQPTTWQRELWEWIKIIAAAAAIALFLNSCIIANSEVPSGSMENTIMTGDRVIGSRLSYLFSEPERGDIVIFHFPDNEAIYYVKRVIGLPGETVDIVNGTVYVNGEKLEESYIREPMIPDEPMHFEVPEGCYFMLGDNRNYSADARVWENTYVKKEKIIAKVLFRYWPNPGLIN